MTMYDLSVYTVMTVLCGIIIVSYIFSLLSEKTRIPTVLFLLLLGIGIREFLIANGSYVELPGEAIEFIGIVGLILILLEAGLDINLSREKLPLIRNAAASSIFVLVLSVAGITAAIHFLLNQSLLISMVYAVPLSIISSSIVASSIRNLSEVKREFLTYESSLSDIIGILLFNYLIAEGAFTAASSVSTLGAIILAVVASLVSSLALLWLMAKVTINIKVFLLFAALFLLYSIGHSFHLPSLLVVLVFGLMINNWYKIKTPWSERILPAQAAGEVVYSLKAVTAESAFLIRTFFFLLFGYTIDITAVFDQNVIAVGTIIVIIIYLVRYLYLRLFIRHHVLPELFYAPRGLVTIVLFYRIPQGMQFNSFSDGILFFVVLVTTLLMLFGSWFFTPHEATRQGEEELAEIKEHEIPVVKPPTGAGQRDTVAPPNVASDHSVLQDSDPREST